MLLSGLFILAQHVVGRKILDCSLRLAHLFPASTPICAGVRDTEVWPFGPKPGIQGTLTNPEVIQHRLFAVLLLGVGLLEMGQIVFANLWPLRMIVLGILLMGYAEWL